MYIRDDLWSFNTRDLMRASSCDHCTSLAVARTLGIPDVMAILKEYLEAPDEETLAQKYGVLFEAALMAELEASVAPGVVGAPAKEGDLQQTIELMQSGIPIIYQGGLERTFGQTLFRGRPDFLVRHDWELLFVDGKLTAKVRDDFDSSQINKYVAYDAKYGGAAKPAYLLQVGLYVDALDALGFKAEGVRHGLVLGSRTIETYEEIEIVPVMRLARGKIAKVIEAAEQAKADNDLEHFSASELSWHCPAKSNCDICEYPELCKKDRLAKDDLVQVANITQSQIARLSTEGIKTMRELAAATDSQRPAKMTEETYNKVRRQASAQVESIDTGMPVSHLLPDSAIQFLPPRSGLDIFFDFEGFPYYTERGGLEYLFGNYDWGSGKNEKVARDDLFTEFWAHDRDEEKIAFEQFMLWAMDRMKRDPKAHIYHYANYEQAALKRLANRHGVFEQEVDWLIKTGRLVDMFTIVRNSLVVGEDSYSIKKLERHYEFERSSDVLKASASIDEYDRWRGLVAIVNDPSVSEEKKADAQAEAEKVYGELRLYNLEDVWSTRELYRWLEGMEGACSKFDEPDFDSGDEEQRKSNKSIEELAALQAQTQALFDKVADHEWGIDPEADYRAQIWLALTHSILYYKREDVMYWADLNMRVAMEDEALEAERGGGVIRNLVELERIPKERKDGRLYEEITYRAELDPDDLFNPKDGLKIAVRYKDSKKIQRWDFGVVKEVAGSSITFTRDPSDKSMDLIPNAIIDALHIPTTSKQAALLNLATAIAADWGTPQNEPPRGPAIMDILMRRPPKLKGLDRLPKADSNDYLPAVKEAIKALDNSVLAIQGPPGSGKTYLASRTIKDLVAAGKRVGVAANSHSAVENLLEACLDAGVSPENIVKYQRAGETDRPWTVKKTVSAVGTHMKKALGGYVVGGTNFFFCNKDITPYKLDYLFIDEAAQFSLVDCMAVSAMADNIVLMGDPLQLPQVVLAVHPGGVENSALGHYMGDYSILPSRMGYFIEVTRRLHPEVNHAVSWLAYEGKLRSHEITKTHVIEGHEQGLITVPVAHKGNSTSSEEEAVEVLRLVKSLYRDDQQNSVLVVAAYNAQVDLLRQTLDQAGYTEDKVMVGTVDKFQGREGMAVIYSFAASSSFDAPRGLEFLLDRNRLNVAISRAKATCYIVFSETLLESQFKSVAEVKAVSRLAGLLEMAAK
jgi:uncharacterized protein